MLTSDAIRHFGTRFAIGKALRAAGIQIEPAAVYRWGERVPELRQLQLEALTGGALKAAPGIRPDRVTHPEPVAA